MDQQTTYQGPEGGAEMPALGAGIVPPPPNQQLPAQMFTTAAQLLDLTDKKLMISLRDGRKLIGILRSWDHKHRPPIYHRTDIHCASPSSSPQGATQPGLYADIPRGLFLVRGENVLLLGEIDLDKDDEAPPGYEKADAEVVNRLDKERRAMEAKRDKNRLRKLAELGFEGENSGEAIFG
ncbi:small nuclear ribonucleoprotein [Botrytis cinerea]